MEQDHCNNRLFSHFHSESINKKVHLYNPMSISNMETLNLPLKCLVQHQHYHIPQTLNISTVITSFCFPFLTATLVFLQSWSFRKLEIILWHVETMSTTLISKQAHSSLVWLLKKRKVEYEDGQRRGLANFVQIPQPQEILFPPWLKWKHFITQIKPTEWKSKGKRQENDFQRSWAYF